MWFKYIYDFFGICGRDRIHVEESMRAIKDRVEVLKWKVPHMSTRTLTPPSGRCVATAPKQTNTAKVFIQEIR